MVGIRTATPIPAAQNEAVLAEDIIAMIETLDRGNLRGLRDRAMLLVGYAGGLRSSEMLALTSRPIRRRTVAVGSKCSTRA